MSSDEKQPFLARWSRRKLESSSGGAPKPDVSAPSIETGPPAAPGVRSAPSKPELPSVDSLRGLASEYREFLHPEVDQELRRLALKKLFHDPHFNVMDGLDTYIDDYSKPDPIPPEMLERLKQANRVLFPEEAAPKDAPDESGIAGTAVTDAGGERLGQGEAAPQPQILPPGAKDKI